MTEHNRQLPDHLAYCKNHDQVYDVNTETDHIVKSTCPLCDNERIIKELCGGDK